MKIKYKAGYRYQLVGDGWSIQTKIRVPGIIETRYIILTRAGILVIRPGYAWDGPSGPAIDSTAYMRASLAHDALYQLMREEELSIVWRKEADDLLYDLCVKDGMWWVRAYIAYRAVRKLAGEYATSKKRKKILEAGS